MGTAVQAIYMLFKAPNASNWSGKVLLEDNTTTNGPIDVEPLMEAITTTP